MLCKSPFRIQPYSPEECLAACGGNRGGKRQGEVRSYDSYHKRHKLLYDDSADEWVALSRQRFRWLTPRGRTAGPHRQACS